MGYYLLLKVISKMKTNIIQLILLFLFGFQCYADSLYMNIRMKNGTSIISDITEMPIITFEGGIMSIGTDQIHVDNILKYTIQDNASSIEKIGESEMRVDLCKVGQGIVTVVNLEKQTVSLCDVSGLSLPFATSNAGSTTIIDFSELTSGIYILTIGNQSIKCKKQ